MTKISQKFEAELTFKTNMDRYVYFQLFVGKKVTNNWFKMQGGILDRKQAYRKAQKNRRRKQHGKKSTS